jgi:hypothetical protein
MIEHYVIFPQSNKPQTPAFPGPRDKYNNGNSKKIPSVFQGHNRKAIQPRSGRKIRQTLSILLPEKENIVLIVCLFPLFLDF